MVNINRVRRERGSRKRSWFYHINDGYHYHINNIRNRKVYLKCIHFGKHCHGRALYSRRQGFIHTKRHDGCRRDRHYPNVMRLRRRILKRCTSLEVISFREIITQESRGFPIGVTSRVRLANMRSAMQRARYSALPPPPQSLEELTAILQDPRYRVLTATSDGRDNLYAASVNAADGSHHVIFMTRRMARVLRQLKILFGDGTFKTLPNMEDLDAASQIFCVVGNWDHTVLPVAWVLMQARTIPAYTAVLSAIQDLVGNVFPNLETFISDFEPAIRASVIAQFPGVTLQGCFFHLVRVSSAFTVKLKNQLLK
ncbi:uncharacterized protein LOC127751763 [Frankliniella occidentalis]|uniref:Uncharacterized protein LOC127751761 n=1 Tax=Frankliniella occidentalis TaxID=133901 RepID=A0A9C6X9I5_FRAOC|nr:uncharacterized protein LOC127751761 [Frankliniella occidentalis]XP_052131750.1 uncharacterized protein LOC127751763 [Frankliniella occidentalis]